MIDVSCESQTDILGEPSPVPELFLLHALYEKLNPGMRGIIGLSFLSQDFKPYIGREEMRV